MTATAARPAETEERWEDHWPGPHRRPCFGYYPQCKAMTSEQAEALSPSEFAKAARKAGGCGDCTIFHAQYLLQKVEAERREAAKKAIWQYKKQIEANQAAREWEHAQKGEEDE